MQWTSTPEPEGWEQIQDDAQRSADGLGLALRTLGFLVLVGVGVVVALKAGPLYGIATALALAAVLVWVIDPVQEKGDRR